MQTYFDSNTRRVYLNLENPSCFVQKNYFCTFCLGSLTNGVSQTYRYDQSVVPLRDTAAYIRETANLLAFIKKKSCFFFAQSAHLLVESLTRLLVGMKKYPLRATKKDFSPIRSPTAGGELWPCEPHEINSGAMTVRLCFVFFYIFTVHDHNTIIIILLWLRRKWISIRRRRRRIYKEFDTIFGRQ